MTSKESQAIKAREVLSFRTALASDSVIFRRFLDALDSTDLSAPVAVSLLASLELDRRRVMVRVRVALAHLDARKAT